MTDCDWCGAALGAGEPSCHACGAPVDLLVERTASGWRERPALPAQVNLGQGSTCAIGGGVTPVADVNLAAGDAVYFQPHSLLWSVGADVEALPLPGSAERRFAGLPFVLAAARGPGHVATSHSSPGTVVALPMAPGTSVEAREHALLLASVSVRFSFHGFAGGTDTSSAAYPSDASGTWLDRFLTRDSPGLVLLHGAGTVYERTLAEGEQVTVRPGAFLYKDPSVTAEPVDRVLNRGLLKRRTYLLRITGPGRLGVQSAFVNPEPAPASRLST